MRTSSSDCVVLNKSSESCYMRLSFHCFIDRSLATTIDNLSRIGFGAGFV